MNLKILQPIGWVLLLHSVAALGLCSAERRKVMVTSTIDGSQQPCYVILPGSYLEEPAPAPLLVSLHTWSGDVEQRNMALEAEAEEWT